MSKIYFNPETGGFHHDRIDGARMIAAEQTAAEIKAKKRPEMIPNPHCRIPESAIEITAERYGELMQAQAAGKRIQASRDGRPVAVDWQPDPDERRNQRRIERNRRLSASDWTQLPDSPLTSAERKAWSDYRRALRDLDMDGTDWPEVPGEGA